MKNATRLPKPVDNPADRENRKAITIVSMYQTTLQTKRKYSFNL